MNGSFTIDGTTSNLFDPLAAAQSSGLFSVPAGAGNVVSANNVAINDTSGPEFVTIIFPADCPNTTASVDVTSAGLVTYDVQFGTCSIVLSELAITLTSAAFSGCKLTPVSSTFPGQGQGTLAGGPFNNTVTGSLQGSTLSLTAEYLTYIFIPQGFPGPKDNTSLTASWRLEGCPAVSLWAALMTAEAVPLCAIWRLSGPSLSVSFTQEPTRHVSSHCIYSSVNNSGKIAT